MNRGQVRGALANGTGRRKFLSNCMIAGMAGLGPSLSIAGSGHFQHTEAMVPGRDSFLLELHQKTAMYGGADGFRKFRHELAACALNPWTKEWLSEPYEEKPNSEFWALVEARHTLGGPRIVTLLDYVEEWGGVEDDPVPDGKLLFMDWLKVFRPVSRDDFLMALPLYGLYRDGFVGNGLLPDIHPTPDPWLDAMFGGTRGMLVWNDQLRTLIRIGSYTGKRTLTDEKLRQGYLLQRAEALDVLGKSRYAGTGQSLLEIIRERSPLYRTTFGSPDYLVGTWLQRYFS